MFKVLLADDEKTILEGVKALIDWESFGFEVCATARNGQELIDLAEQHRPHLIITDIKMPKMDGITVISKLREMGFETEIILLTGYAEFDYAKSALEYGAAAYLMKPVDEEELSRQIQKVCDKLSESKQSVWREEAQYLHKASMQGVDDYASGPATLNLDDKFTIIAIEFVFGEITGLEEIESFNELTKNIRAANQKPAEPWEDTPLADVFEAIRVWADNSLACKSWLTNARDGYFLFINDEASPHIPALRDFFAPKPQIRLLISETASGMYSLNDSMLTLEGCRYDYFYSEPGPVIFTGATQLHNLAPAYEHPDVEKICSHVFASRIEESIETLLYAEERLRVNQNPPPIIEAYVNLLTTRLALFMDENFYMGHDLYMLGEALKPAIRRMRISQLTAVLIRTLRLVNNVVQDAAKESDMGVVKNVVLYLKDNFSDKITIKTVSEMYFINTAYLGQLFKRKMGVSFHDYLAGLRMERAKQLLITTAKSIADISAEVGFEDPNYFSARFGKTEGMTPREYRVKMQQI